MVTFAEAEDTAEVAAAMWDFNLPPPPVDNPQAGGGVSLPPLPTDGDDQRDILCGNQLN